jgi:predicted anti-sigma-YlaC factor YlaD
MLSTFESALLDRHLRGCADCRLFADDAGAQTQLLRAAVPERPSRPILLPSAHERAVPRRLTGVLSACLVVAAAAAVLVWPGSRQAQSGQGLRTAARVGAPVMMVFAAEPTVANKSVEVPRLRMQPASIADGPVHGYFGSPV